MIQSARRHASLTKAGRGVLPFLKCPNSRAKWDALLTTYADPLLFFRSSSR